jgi:hypothetical protein
LRGSGNLKMAQELARHKNIAVTQRYAHLSDDELDKGYWDVFEDHLANDIVMDLQHSRSFHHLQFDTGSLRVSR